MRLTLALLLLLFSFPAGAEQAKSCFDALYVNHCRLSFGAAANHYKAYGKGAKNQIIGFEKRIGRRMDVAHTYHAIGVNSLTEDDYALIDHGLILMANWKPAERWADAAGGNASINAGIDEMARSIAKAAPTPIMLAIYHEPEDQVEGGTSCPSYSNKPKAGTPADYRAMWKNVRDRFDALGVKNVVWVMNYMGYDRWNCMVNDLWPGNELVDWVMWDSYAHPQLPWPDSPMRMYDFLSQNSTPEHDYLSKPWGLNEFGVWGEQDYVHAQYANMRKALDENAMPRLNMYVFFDVGDSKAGFTKEGAPAPEEQADFNRFANHPRFTENSTR